jgi:hypothetical protein
MVAAATSLVACFPPTEGREPPLDEFYFPVGLAISQGPDSVGASGDAGAAELSAPARWLYVANSDFDLQFNSGSLLAFDLERLRQLLPVACESDADCDAGRVCDLPRRADLNGGEPTYWCVDPADPKPCGALGEKSAPDRLLAPGRCSFIDPVAPPSGAPILVDAISIGAFVTDVIYQDCPTCDQTGVRHGRLFMPVRGDATLHWVDVAAGADGPGLDCGQDSAGACDDNHRRGTSPDAENSRGLQLPPEPYGVAADERGEAIVVAHQLSGQVALFVNDWQDGAAGGPRLEFVLGGLSSGALAVASVPEAAIVNAGPEPLPHEPAFLVAFTTSSDVTLLRYFDDAASAPERPFLDASRSAPITTNSQGFHSRGIAVDAAKRKRCEAGCAQGDLDCLRACAGIPVGVYVTNRTPATLVVGQTQPNHSETTSDDLPRFIDTIPVSLGASRVVVGEVLGPDGVTLLPRVFVVCFDSRKIYVFDPVAGRIEAVIQTGRGPHAFSVDPRSGLGFIAHFTDSYVGVVDLDQSHAHHYGSIIATLGAPTPPRSSK